MLESQPAARHGTGSRVTPEATRISAHSGPHTVPMTGRRRSSAGLALAAALLAIVSTAGCGSEPASVGAAPPSAPPGAERASVVAQRYAWGGIFAGGPCRSDLTVRSDGSWALETEVGTSEGLLPASQRARLEEAVAETGLADDVEPATGCAADFDDTSIEYLWLVQGAHPQTASSCEQVIVADDPLVQRLDAILADITP